MCLFVHVKTVLKENVVFSLKWWRPDVNETWRGIFCFINIVYFFYRFTIERVTPNGKHQLLKSFSKSTKKDDNTTCIACFEEPGSRQRCHVMPDSTPWKEVLSLSLSKWPLLTLLIPGALSQKITFLFSSSLSTHFWCINLLRYFSCSPIVQVNAS